MQMVGQIEISVYLDPAQVRELEQAIENHPDHDTVSSFGRDAINQLVEDHA